MSEIVIASEQITSRGGPALWDGVLKGGEAGGYALWRRVPDNSASPEWPKGGVLGVMLESGTKGVWDVFAIDLDLLHTLSAMPFDRLGDRMDDSDPAFSYDLSQHAMRLRVAPLVDGALAMARGDGADRAIRIAYQE